MSKFVETVKKILGQGASVRRGKPPMPRGLGGYRLNKIGEAYLDPRQAAAQSRCRPVPVLYAEMIERNKYFPDGKKR